MTPWEQLTFHTFLEIHTFPSKLSVSKLNRATTTATTDMFSDHSKNGGGNGPVNDEKNKILHTHTRVGLLGRAHKNDTSSKYYNNWFI